MSVDMPIQIDHKPTEEALARLVYRQPIRTSKTALAVAVIQAAVARCDETGDPEAWRHAPARRNGGAPSVHGSTDSTPAPAPVSSSTDQAMAPTTPLAPAPERGPDAVAPR